MGRRALLSGIVAGLLFLTTSSPTVAAAEDPPPLRFGFAMGSVDELLGDDVPLSYGSFWVGAWTQKSGWGYAASQLDAAVAANVTPVVNWWYWGDDISPSCVENGCWSNLHNVAKDKATWTRMANELADLVQARMKGREAIVVVENEFNKGGISTYEPFDGYLAEQSQIFHARGVKTVVGFGFWDSARWSNFDRAVATSDYAGTMMLRSSLRHASSYDASADDLLVAAQTLKTKFGKPLLLYDFALSSYPEPDFATRQEKQVARLFALMPELRAAGVEGILLRHLYDDPNFNPANYNGEAERWWGLKHSDGSAKPAYDDAILGMHEEAVHVLTRGEAWTLAAGATRDARLYAWKDAWYAMRIVGSGAPVTISVDGVAVRSVEPTASGARVAVPLGAGEHAVAFSSSGATIRVEYDDVAAPAPAPGLLGAFEAESFAEKSTGGRYADDAASGDAGWNVWSAGWIQHAVRNDATRDVWVTVTARADLAGSEAPRMDLSMNGLPTASWSVSSAQARTYAAQMRVPAGDVDIRLTYPNDWYGGDGKDRNLRIDVVRVTTAPPALWSAEAESFPVKSTGGRYDDAKASAQAGWNLWSNGYAQTTLWNGYDGPQTLAIVAKGDYAAGWPTMRVWIDGVRAGDVSVGSTTYRTYSLATDLAPGAHTVRVEFVNDYKSGAADRNLRLDAATLNVG